MSSDPSIESLIDELKTDYHRSQFESLFKRKTKHLSGPEKLQARMRITELAKPALGVIDLRKKIQSEIEPYPFQGRVHYFDLAAKRLFEDGLRLYKGVFTNDTKQQILALKTQHQQLAEDKALAQQEQEKALASFVAGREYQRCEQRINLVSAVTMELADGQEFSAMTVDISNSGLQLKLSLDHQLTGLKYARVKVYFSGLSDDFVFDATQEYEYRVVGLKEKDFCLYLRLRRMDETGDDELGRFLAAMLNKSRRRYKVNVEHLAQRVTARVHESCWFDAVQAVPFILKDGSASCALVQTKSNQTLLNSWQQHQGDLIAELIEQPWVQSVINELRKARKPTRRQVTLFRISLPINKVWREYLLPLQAIQKEKNLIATLNALRAAGYGARCYQLTLTHSKDDELVYGELNAIKTPLWREHSNEKLKLSVLQEYQTKGAKALSCKLLSPEASAEQNMFRYALSSALFLYKSGVDWEPQLAALMSISEGLPKLFDDTEFWLANNERLLGGRRLSSELRKALRRVSENSSLSPRILLLRVTQATQKDGVMGREISEYDSFEEAAEYIRFLDEDDNFLALLVAGQPCQHQISAELMTDLSYIQRYLPHRAKELESSFKQLRGVITLTDVTQTLSGLAQLTEQP
jgi:hypothetical protein